MYTARTALLPFYGEDILLSISALDGSIGTKQDESLTFTLSASICPRWRAQNIPRRGTEIRMSIFVRIISFQIVNIVCRHDPVGVRLSNSSLMVATRQSDTVRVVC